MYTMPILDTVAGEAFSMLCTSNSSLQVGAMGMRSPLARVSVLLSSNTEFKFSIQMASTGPSRMRKMFSPANKDGEEGKIDQLFFFFLRQIIKTGN